MYLFWIGFLVIIVFLLILDLKVFHKNEHEINFKEALYWTGFWVFLALLFNVFIYYAYSYKWFGIGLNGFHVTDGKDAAMKFFTGYIIEKSLSMDNIFVMAMIFGYFKVPSIYQHRVLYWGILGALIMRGIMIISGIGLIRMFDWIIYVFGALLILTAIKMLFTKDEDIEPEKNFFVKTARKLYPVTSGYIGHQFFTKIDGKRAITPLFLVLLMVESTDVLFAVDSIPAIFGITTDPYIVFTSNIFAILGLRSLYFALAVIIEKFQFMKYALVIVLILVGIKMLLAHVYEIPTLYSLGVIALVLFAGILVSILGSKDTQSNKETPPSGDH